MSEISTIDRQFIEENSKFCPVMSSLKRKRGGPYSKTERQKRRAEVYRLHFELGVPATRIAEYLKINRHTIEDDINVLYEELGKQYFETSISGFMQKQLNRLESQRTRLLGYLEKCNNIEEKLPVERLIYEIDQRLTHTVVHVWNNEIVIWNGVANRINEFAKKKKLDLRWYSPVELIEITKKQREVIDKILKDR